MTPDFARAAAALLVERSPKLPDWAQGDLFASLHHDCPVRDQSDCELAVDGYQRIALARGDALRLTPRGVEAALALRFGRVRSLREPARATHLAIGTRSSAAGKLLLVVSFAEAVELRINTAIVIDAGTLLMNAPAQLHAEGVARG